MDVAQTIILVTFRPQAMGNPGLPMLLLRFDPGPRVFEGGGPGEDRFSGGGILGINEEVTDSLELEPAAGLGVAQAGFQQGGGQDLE